MNSSSRRSGSQVTSILQEATQSHQIATQRATKQSALSQDGKGDEDKPSHNEKLSRTITSFFKPVKAPAAKIEDGGAQSKDTASTEVFQQCQLTLASHSVILVEEVRMCMYVCRALFFTERICGSKTRKCVLLGSMAAFCSV